MKVTFKNCWVGTYVGDGNYEGGSCPDITITNVPNSKDLDELYDEYINVLTDDTIDYGEDEKEYDITKSYIRGKKPVKITKRHEIIECTEPYIEIDFKLLMDLHSNDTLYEVRYSNGKPTKIVSYGEIVSYGDLTDFIENCEDSESVEEIWSLDYEGYEDELIWDIEDGEIGEL